jgi:hypothetical protein
VNWLGNDSRSSSVQKEHVMAKDPAIVERDKRMREKWIERMQDDFAPGYTPEATPKAEDRMVRAVEYAAYQLGKINQSMVRIANALEKKDGGQPKS